MTECPACATMADHVAILIPWGASGRILVQHHCPNQRCPSPRFAEPVRDLAGITLRIDVALARAAGTPARLNEPAPIAPQRELQSPESPPAPPTSHAPSTPAAPVESIGVIVRALVDIPPFVDQDMKTQILKQGDLATVPKGVADLLERRGKVARVHATLQPQVPA